MRRVVRRAIGLAVALVSVAPTRAQDQPPPRSGDLAARIEQCTTCHGEQGVPQIAEAPVIWGQEFYYLYVQLRDYQSGLRENEMMQAVVADLSRDDMKALADHFSKLKWPANAYRTSAEDEEKGRQVATAGQCTQCHLGAYTGNSRVPRLAGQSVRYLEKTMLDFKYKRRGNSADMSSLLASFDDPDVIAMAHYIAGM